MQHRIVIAGVATLFASAAALAQTPDIPLKKTGPLLDKRALAIPGKLPLIQEADPVAKPRGLPSAPPPQRAPQPVEDSTPGFGDIKKTASDRCKPLKSSDTVQFEFKAADIKDVVSAISKTMCKNFIITQKVRSQKFDIISPTEITVAEAWRAFMSALEANDFAITQAGKYYKIIQATDGTRSPVPIYEDGEGTPNVDIMITKIWKIRHATDINAVVNYLNIFKSGKGQIHPFHATNTIVATDYGTSMVRLERILEELDVPGTIEKLHIVPVEFAAASEIAEKLSQIFEPAKAAPGKPVARAPVKGAPPGAQAEDDSLSVSKILADDRTNNLIIIASDSTFKRIMNLKKKLDVPGDSGEGQVHVLRLKHADAEELAGTLSSLASGSASQKGRGAAPVASPVPRPPGQTGGSAAIFQGEVKVTSDKATNSLVVTASKVDMASVRRVITQLDVPRLQVFVEAVILEVSMKRDRNLGTSWYGGIPVPIDGKDSPILFGSAPNRDLNALSLSANPLGLASLLGFSAAARGPTLPGSEAFTGGVGIPSVGVVLQALQSSNDINVVSTPHLLTLDNEEAEIQVSEKRPFPAGLSLGGGGLGGLGGLAGLAGQAQNLGGTNALSALGNLGGLGLGSVAINREDVGLTLKLKPQINDDEYVRLQIDQELSDVAGLDQVTGQTITSKRAAKTVVVVRDQESVVIGGLVRDRDSEDESKVPLLGDLPLLGWLFKRTARITDKVNLLLVVTPYIIRGPDDFRRVYERKMVERKEFVDRFYGAVKEYQASVDWTRKVGPLARFREDLKDEMIKIENGGPGLDGEILVTPPAAESTEVDGEPMELPSGGGGEGASPSIPVPPPPPPPIPDM